MRPASVQAFVAEQHAPDATLYLLLDPLADCAADDPLRIEVLRQTLGDDAVTPVHRPDLIHTSSACPVLVTLATPGSSPSQALLALSALRAHEEVDRHKRYVCGWLSSSAPSQALSAHIVSLGWLPLEQGRTFSRSMSPFGWSCWLALLATMRGPGGPFDAGSCPPAAVPAAYWWAGPNVVAFRAPTRRRYSRTRPWLQPC